MAVLSEASIEICVLYGQVHACRPGHPSPGSLWTDAHVAQGFAWRPEAASFAVQDHDGDCILTAAVAKGEPQVPENAISCVSVPYDVTEGGVEFGGIAATARLAVPNGPYALTFAIMPGGARHALSLGMTLTRRSGPPAFGILRAGGIVTAARVGATRAEEA